MTSRGAAKSSASLAASIPAEGEAVVGARGRSIRLTNLHKPFFPERGLTKGDVLRYYADVAGLLVPHVRDRAMVMKRYPNGAAGDFFFMKRVPNPHPDWLRTCAIEHGSGSVIDFPVVDDALALLWIVNLGCIDLNPWYSLCGATDYPNVLNFDLDPPKGPHVDFARVCEAALLVREGLTEIGLPAYAKTTGSRGIHVYVPIEPTLVQKEVWRFAKAFAQAMFARRPDLVTAEYRIAKRPPERVLVDYNQNAWGRTLASVYSVRSTPNAGVSTPVTWDEVERGLALDAFDMQNVRARFAQRGDLWAPVVNGPRVALERVVKGLG